MRTRPGPAHPAPSMSCRQQGGRCTHQLLCLTGWGWFRACGGQRHPQAGRGGTPGALSVMLRPWGGAPSTFHTRMSMRLEALRFALKGRPRRAADLPWLGILYFTTFLQENIFFKKKTLIINSPIVPEFWHFQMAAGEPCSETLTEASEWLSPRTQWDRWVTQSSLRPAAARTPAATSRVQPAVLAAVRWWPGRCGPGISYPPGVWAPGLAESPPGGSRGWSDVRLALVFPLGVWFLVGGGGCLLREKPGRDSWGFLFQNIRPVPVGAPVSTSKLSEISLSVPMVTYIWCHTEVIIKVREQNRV